MLVRSARGVALLTVGLLVVVAASAARPVHAVNTWTLTGDLATARRDHTSTTLPDGRVLVVGGRSGELPLASAELYDSISGTWSPGASLSTARTQHTATLLLDGKVLVAGGSSGSGLLSSAELYDPMSDSWSQAADLDVARYGHTATRLVDGTVLVVGGWDGTYSSSAERYDPVADEWTPAGSLATARGYHTATRLSDGDVLVVGGLGGGGPAGHLASAERFDPALNTWTSAGALSTGRYLHTSTLLADGTVLVFGGYAYSGYASGGERYFGGMSWGFTGPTTGEVRVGHTATLLPNGTVVIAGGTYGGGLGYSLLYYPVQDFWYVAGYLATFRSGQTASLLPNNRILVAGGVSIVHPAVLASAELTEVCAGDTDCDSFGAPQTYHYGPVNSGPFYFLYDNCFDTPNPGQENTDGNFVDITGPYVLDDQTWPRSDALGDACDADDDNDGITDADEADGGTGCAAVTNPLLRDTDADRFLDGAECALGTNPTSSASKPLVTACGTTTDADGDKLTERVEVCFYGTDPNNSDTDGDKGLDGAKDGCEAASFNGDRIVNVADMGMLATAISNVAFRVVSVDVNKDGVWNPADQGLVASFISPSGQCPG